MQFAFQTYHAGSSLVHRLDARVKLVLLVAFVIAVFFVDTMLGLAAFTAILALLMAVSGVPAGKMLSLAAPAYILAVLVWMINALSVTSSGFETGLFYAVRIVLLVLAVLLVSLTTSSNDLTNAFRDFLTPLRSLGVPVDDVATVLTIALRFIPLTAEEFARVRNAQWSRGAAYDEGSPFDRLKVWGSTLIPLIAGLFRRADSLAEAMDSRCYGAVAKRTSLDERRLAAGSLFALIAGLVICAMLACVL